MLVTIKLLHTIIWAFMAGCILVLPALGLRRQFRWAAVISGVVLIECVVLAMNGGRCPLTDWAAKYTTERAANFDIYLPMWLAQYNKVIFGTMFVVGEFVVGLLWVRERMLRNTSVPNATHPK